MHLVVVISRQDLLLTDQEERMLVLRGDFDTTPERSPSTDYPSVHYCLTSVFFLFTLFASSISRVEKWKYGPVKPGGLGWMKRSTNPGNQTQEIARFQSTSNNVFF